MSNAIQQFIRKIELAATKEMASVAGRRIAEHCDARVARFRELLTEIVEAQDDPKLLKKLAKRAQALLDRDAGIKRKRTNKVEFFAVGDSTKVFVAKGRNEDSTKKKLRKAA